MGPRPGGCYIPTLTYHVVKLLPAQPRTPELRTMTVNSISQCLPCSHIGLPNSIDGENLHCHAQNLLQIYIVPKFRWEPWTDLPFERAPPYQLNVSQHEFHMQIKSLTLSLSLSLSTSHSGLSEITFVVCGPGMCLPARRYLLCGTQGETVGVAWGLCRGRKQSARSCLSGLREWDQFPTIWTVCYVVTRTVTSPPFCPHY